MQSRQVSDEHVPESLKQLTATPEFETLEDFNAWLDGLDSEKLLDAQKVIYVLCRENYKHQFPEVGNLYKMIASLISATYLTNPAHSGGLYDVIDEARRNAAEAMLQSQIRVVFHYLLDGPEVNDLAISAAFHKARFGTAGQDKHKA